MKSILAIIFLSSSIAQSRPVGFEFDPMFLTPERPATVEDLKGMANLGNCSGGVLDIGRPMNAKSLLITNGHCVSGTLGANQAIINQPSQRFFRLFTYDGSTVLVQAQKLVYATLTDTDLGLYELNVTYEELQSMNVKSYPLSMRSASPGIPLRITSGYWKRTQECAVERIVYKLLEGFGGDVSNPSVATNVLALTNECQIYGGFSGTPAIDLKTQTIIGLAFTVAEGGQKNCEERSPCEEDKNGKRVYLHGVSYVTRVDQIASCFLKGEFDLNQPNCTLYR